MCVWVVHLEDSTFVVIDDVVVVVVVIFGRGWLDSITEFVSHWEIV